MESTLKNMVLVLLIITAVCSAAVGVVYDLTKEPIAQTKVKKINDALQLVVPKFDNNPSEARKDIPIDADTVRLYTLTYDGQITGYAVETFSDNGFAGRIAIMVGFLPDGTIHGTEVISHAETPGLGDKIDKNKSPFSLQFTGKNPADFRLAVKKDGGDVDAITAATISSRAFTDAIDRAYRVLKENK